eukprot:g4642.t1
MPARVSFTLPGFTTQQQIELDGEIVTAPTHVDTFGKYWRAYAYDDAVKICERAFNCEYIAESGCANHFRQNYGGAGAQAGDAARILTPQDVRDTWATDDQGVAVRLGDHELATKLDATPQTVSDGGTHHCYLQKQSIFRPIVLTDGIASDTELLNVAALTNLDTLTSDGLCTQVKHLSAALDVAEADAGRSVIYSPESCGDSGLGLEAAFDATQGAIVGLTKKDYDAGGWYVCANSVSSSLDKGGAGACVLLNPKQLLRVATTTTTTLSASDLEIVAGATAEQLGPASGYRCTQDNASKLNIESSSENPGALSGYEAATSHDDDWNNFFVSQWAGNLDAKYVLQSDARITLIEITETAKLWENHCADKAGFLATKDDGLPWACQTDIMEPGTPNDSVDQRLRTNFAVEHASSGEYQDCYRMRLVDEGSGSHVFNPRPDLDALAGSSGNINKHLWTVLAWCNIPKVYAGHQREMKMYRELDPLKRLRVRDVRLFGYPGAPPAAFVSEWIVRLKDGPKGIHSILFAIPSKVGWMKNVNLFLDGVVQGGFDPHGDYASSAAAGPIPSSDSQSLEKMWQWRERNQKSEVLYQKSGAKPVAQEIKLAVDTARTDAGGDTPEQNMFGLVTLCGVEITIEVPPATVTTTTTVTTATAETTTTIVTTATAETTTTTVITTPTTTGTNTTAAPTTGLPKIYEVRGTTTATKLLVFYATDVFFNKQQNARGATVLPVLNAIGDLPFPQKGAGAGGASEPLLTLQEMRKYTDESVPLSIPAGEVLTALDVLLDWRDQGRGNQKGGLRVELRRNAGGGGSASTIAEKWFEFAPQKRKAEAFKLLHGADAIVTDAQDGDYYRLGARVGEYPQHRLYLHFVSLGVKYGTPPSSRRQLREL